MQASNGIREWSEIVAEKRKQQASLLAPWTSVETTPEEDAITSIPDASFLYQQIASQKLSSVTVATAYIKRAAYAHQKTNCLTEICFNKALARARKLDEHIAVHGKPVGPLHGIPITLKDQFDVKGFDTTLGYVARAGHPAPENAVLVNILESLGAVILAKTNLPQSIMWCETDNPLWGLTTNPRNAAFTPGGSSGGEGAVLALHGSLVGFGTDIGGSVRIPSHINGLYGLKPSSGRLPYAGVPVSTEGQEHVPSVVGPLARTLSSIIDVTKEIIKSEPWLFDAKVHRLPWRQDEFEETQSRPLVIGVILDDGAVRVHPPTERVMRELCGKLERAGHEVVPWDVSGHKECIAIMDQFYVADGGEDIRRAVNSGGEPFIPHVQALLDRAKHGSLSVYEYWQLNSQKIAAQQAQLKKWTEFRSPSGRPVDVLISPTMPHVAVPHRGCKWVGYTKVWNMLDYSALTLPAGNVIRELDPVDLPHYEPRNDIDKWNWELYDLESMAGHPIGVQVIGRRLEEERVLGAAQVVERVLRG